MCFALKSGIAIPRVWPSVAALFYRVGLMYLYHPNHLGGVGGLNLSVERLRPYCTSLRSSAAKDFLRLVFAFAFCGVFTVRGYLRFVVMRLDARMVEVISHLISGGSPESDSGVSFQRNLRKQGWETPGNFEVDHPFLRTENPSTETQPAYASRGLSEASSTTA